MDKNKTTKAKPTKPQEAVDKPVSNVPAIKAQSRARSANVPQIPQIAFKGVPHGSRGFYAMRTFSQRRFDGGFTDVLDSPSNPIFYGGAKLEFVAKHPRYVVRKHLCWEHFEVSEADKAAILKLTLAECLAMDKQAQQSQV